jgi:hypothetical protein
MKTGQWMAVILAVTGLAFAQDGNRQVQKIIEVKYRNPERIMRIIPQSNVLARADSEFHAIVVSGPAQMVAEYEEMVKKFDTPPPNVELTGYLVSASSREAADDLPKDLAPTAKQLHGLFAYKSYRVFQTLILRSRDGRGAQDSGTLPNSNSQYELSYASASVSPGTPRAVHIDGIRLEISTPSGQLTATGPLTDKNGHLDSRRATVQSDIDMNEGQYVVVGKSSTNSSDDALILIVTAKVVQ